MGYGWDFEGLPEPLRSELLRIVGAQRREASDAQERRDRAMPDDAILRATVALALQAWKDFRAAMTAAEPYPDAQAALFARLGVAMERLEIANTTEQARAGSASPGSAGAQEDRT